MNSYRVGIIGFGHMHVNHVAQIFASHPQVQLVACADTIPLRPELRTAPYTRAWNQQHVMSDLGVAKAYASYHEMLERADLDLAIVTCENAQHPDVVEACAAAGVHVCVEKPMAMSMADALRMARACRSHGTHLLVNWPLTWSAAARRAKELLDAGAIGQVLEVRWRSGHNGPLGAGVGHAGVSETAGALTGPEKGATWWHQEAAGGGALLDYCCYGCMVARWYVGEQAQAAYGMKANLASQWGDANDNGAMIVRFPQSFALMEGSWTTLHHGVATGPIVHGTEGTLVVETRPDQEIVRLERGAEQTEVVTPDPLPAGRTTIAEEYVRYLETGESPHITLQMGFNLESMAILDAGLRSADSGQQELVNNAAWTLG
jgi:glucose-fructose oxidoreductase